MRRDNALVRELLLKVEAIDIPPGSKIAINGWDEGLQLEGYSPEDIDRHLRLLVDGGLLTGKGAMDGVITSGLSWEGCEFLDAIRNAEVWKRTQAAAAKVGGGAISMLGEIAKAIAMSLVKEKLGIDIG